MYDVIIVGAGPAGLTAAIYTLRQSKKTLVIESLSYGGQIINTKDIENYPAINHIDGFTLATNMFNQAKSFGMEYVNDEVIEIIDGNIKTVKTKSNEYKAKKIIIATGVTHRPLGVEKELELIGKGISYCATCDGAFYKGKDVAVVGGGNTALEDALFLSDYCNKVYLIHRRDEFRGDLSTVNKLKQKSNVELVLESNVTRLEANDKLETIEVTNKNGNKKELNVSCLFVAIGQIPHTNFLNGLLELDESGYIKTNEFLETSVKDIYAAGDVVVKQIRQLTTATSDGTIAAINACKE